MQRGSWDDIFARGMGQFVWFYGVVCFGGLFFLANTLVRWLSNNPDLRYDLATVASLIVVSFAYSLCVGAAFGIVTWHTARLIRTMTRKPKHVNIAVKVHSPAAANK